MRGMVIKLYPNKVQRSKIQEHIDTCRFVYNKALEIRIEAYKNEQLSIGAYAIMSMLTVMKNTDEYNWINDTDSQSIQYAVLNLDTAYKSFFRRVKLGTAAPGFPRFRSRKRPVQSYQYPQRVKVNDQHSKIYLPKIGWVKCRGYRDDLPGSIKTVTIKLHSDGYITASVLVDYTPVVEPLDNTTYIGLDVGVKKIVTDSTGYMFLPLDIGKDITRMKKLQRTRQRTVDRTMLEQGVTKYQDMIPSNNLVRTHAAITKLFRKITNKRDYYLHTIANHYLGYRVIYVEDLNIKQMLSNTVGTEDNPNYMSRMDKRLHNLVSNQSWGKLFSILEYKLSIRKAGIYSTTRVYISDV